MKADPVAAWLAVEHAVMDMQPTHDAYRDGFWLARVAHGLLGQHGVDPFKVSPHRAARRILAFLLDHHKPPEAAEHLEVCWLQVVVPEAWCPVRWALQRHRWAGKPKPVKGRYLSRQQRMLATDILGIFRHLPPDSQQAVWASTRTLAEVLGVSKSSAAAALKALVSNKHLHLQTPGNQAHSPRFTLDKPLDR